MTVVVSDTSPIRALDWIGQLDVLAHLYGCVVIPRAVCDELLHAGKRYRAIDVATIPFVQVRDPTSRERLPPDSRLDAGETEALNLAMALGADVVLIDELAGRKVAFELGLQPVGTIGILLRAKRDGLIPEIRALISELRSGLGFFLSDALVAEALRRANESY